jgi:signal peptidase I
MVPGLLSPLMQVLNPLWSLISAPLSWVGLATHGPIGEEHTLFRRNFNEFIDSIVQAGVSALLLIHFIVRSYYIPSGSMIPTLQIKDYILVNELQYQFSSPARGDVAVFHPPDSYHGDKEDLIKRVVGIEGDTIEVRGGKLYRNDLPVVEPYIKEDIAQDFPAYRVKPGHVFMMGDNRNDSYDSRYWGDVPLKNYVGKAEFIFFPLHRMGRIR